jgi:hypothetical protein
MADKSWKAFERRIAKLFGCKRRGADFRGELGGKDDLTHAHYSVECKLLSRPQWNDIERACIQAECAAYETATSPSREPIAIIKKKFDEDDNAFVVSRLSTWKTWHL